MRGVEGEGELPSVWCWTVLEEIAEINPKFDRKEAEEDLEATFLPMRCVEEISGRLDLSLTRKTGEVMKGYTHFSEGDVLFAKITPCMENGKVAVAHSLKNGIGFGSTEFHVIRPRDGLPPGFLFFYLIQEGIRKEAKRHMTGSAGQLRVPTGYIRRVPIPLPPLSEQHHIIAKIEELFTKLNAGVGSLKTAKMQLKAYRQSILKAAVEGKLTEKWREEFKNEVEPASAFLERILKKRHNRWEAAYIHQIEASARMPPKDWKDRYKEPPIPDTSELPQLPIGWTWSTTSQICESIDNGNTPSPDKMSSEGEIPFIKVYNLTKTGQLDFSIKPTYISRNTHEGELAKSRIIPGDMLMNIVGPPLGKVSLVPPTYPEWNTNQAVVVFRPLQEVSTSYFLTCLLSNFVLHRVISKARATAGQFNISLTMCRNLPIPLPPSTEQEEISLLAGRVLSIIDRLDQTVDRGIQDSDKLRQAVLKNAFLGKLVPQDPDDVPASVLLERIKAQKEGYTGRDSEGRPSQAKIDAFQVS